MKKIKRIRILDKYDVVVGSELLMGIKNLIDLENFSQVLVITDSVLDKLWSKKLMDSLPANTHKIVVESGEKAKSIDNVQKIWANLLKFGIDRKSLIINLGGGVIGDMGGFAASTYMRGIAFLQIPTTLLAQVDASIGGKVGINFNGVKNLIGAFNQPISVICDVSLLTSLPDREFIEGFGEIIKHGIIADKKYFQFVTSKKPREFNKDELVSIIAGSCEIKKKIIEQDVTEKDSRRLVNFGHTIGHALESLSWENNEPLLHGEAVSLGMVAECKVAVLKGMLKEVEFNTIIRVLGNAGLPTRYKNFEDKEAVKKVKSDKKSEKGVVYFTLIPEIGRSMTGKQVSDGELAEALQFIKG